MVRGNGDALEQLFLNVILNAAQALQADGEAVVRFNRERASAVVTIHDDGIGIPAEDLERVFDPLFSTKEGGTGLGLTIARRIARAAGGDIHVDSACAAPGPLLRSACHSPPQRRATLCNVHALIVTNRYIGPISIAVRDPPNRQQRSQITLCTSLRYAP